MIYSCFILSVNFLELLLLIFCSSASLFRLHVLLMGMEMQCQRSIVEVPTIIASILENFH